MARIALALVLLTAIEILGQSSRPLTPPIDVDLYKDHIKQISPEEVIRAEDEPLPSNLTPIQRAMQSQNRIFGNMVAVELDVIVNENGVVESAKPTSGPQRFFDQAQTIELRKRFAPVVRNGIIIRAHLTDYVSVLPPERWSSNSIPFPAKPRLDTLTISLERTGCLGSCPSYTVSINGQGVVLFTSYSGYQAFVAIPGTHHWHIKPQAVADLVAEFRKANFLNALDQYQCDWTDLPSQTITLSINGITRSVIDYGGNIVGLPSAIEALEGRIDAIAGTARWVTGNEETLPALRAEQWNFAATSKENTSLFNAAIQRNNSDLLQMFLLAKAPIISTIPQEAPICTATETGNIDLVKQLLANQSRRSKIPPDITDECLSHAARAASLSLVELWLDRGAHPTPVPRAKAPDDEEPYEPASPLLNAITSGNPEVVARLLAAHADITAVHNDGHSPLALAINAIPGGEDDMPRHDAEIRIIHLLLDAGADVNEETDNDRAALYDISDAPELVPDLIAAGAEVNIRNEDGETPLMYASTEAAVKALLSAGADPTIRSKDGKSAAEKVSQWSCSKCATLIQQAIADRTGSRTSR